MKTHAKLSWIIAALFIGLVPTACGDPEPAKPQVKNCTISWELNDGAWAAGFKPVTKVEKDTHLAKPKPDPLKEGYTFNGWYTDADFTSQFIFTRVVTKDTTLYAQWIDLFWNISWDLNGGTWEGVYEPPSTVEKGTALARPNPDPTKSGTTFAGWFTNAELTAQYTFTTKVNGNIKLYAKWVDDWIISWNLNNGTWAAGYTPPGQIAHNTVLARPDPDPTKTDATFGGWFTDAALTDVYAFTGAVTDALTLYAKWVEYWDITWNLNGGSWTAGYTPAAKVEKGAVLARPSTPVKSGTIFGGWFANTGLTDAYAFTQAVTADLALYAKWDIYIPGQGPSYIAFTSDVHYGSHSSGNGASANGTSQVASLYMPWMDKLRTQVPALDYMGFCGDNGNANESGAAHWTGIGHLITAADTYKASGFVLNENIFIPGNHEWQTTAGGNLPGIADKEVFPYNRLTYKLEDSGKYAQTADYIIYTSPTGPYDASFSNNVYGQYKQERREALADYLATAPKNIPIFIMAHYPLHSIGTSRVTYYGAEMINILNNYPNVVFFWGHNHSASDRLIHYDTILRPGDKIRAMEGTNTSTAKDMEINFTYMSPGAMRDSGYGDSSNLVIGKGLVIKIDNGKYTFTYYDKDCEPVVNSEKNFPLTLSREELTSGK